MTRKYISLIVVMLLAGMLWTGLVFAGLSEGWTRAAIAPPDDAKAFLAAAQDKAMERNRGNVALILISKGEEAGSFAFSEGEAVDRDSVFQVASLGKWLTAWGVMALVDDGKIDIDAPVSDYLTRWQLPPSTFDNDGVTVRRLLSHTAGLEDGLGYDGFASAEERQTLEQSLTRAGDAAPGKSGEVRLGREPGSGWQYSGGGYTLLQLLVEEVSGQSFSEYMDSAVFAPLGMTRTTFDHDRAIELGLVQNFRPDGTTEPFRWYTAKAATSLFTTAGDLSLFVKAQGPDGRQSVLSKGSRDLVMAPHASQLGAEIWGLGAMLYAPNNRGGFIIGHDGQNGPAINTAARLDPATGDGIVVLSTGTPLLATDLAGEWVFWRTANVDALDFASALPDALLWLAAGWLLLIIIAIMVGYRMHVRKKAGSPAS
ncbi:serine hydrolase domain-containing protein [Croceicoccus gelatinilyticus]|uniref:serine hydrolase domain-containing protein n=1 Tax=Croceicoccus gelatinilyticus TaxID=2835536 RepID=UPI001BCD86A3|nr:serine hydrolase domain-containing protein [Croceicoccus gelatinilyticus]MBS7670651.1 beta-lactamase family protein [Croceicoccus gelatinilyticus]